MKTIEEILKLEPKDAVTEIRTHRPFNVPKPEDIKKEYNGNEHPVMDQALYPDDIEGEEKMTRIVIPDQKLFAKRATSMCVGTPVYRSYNTKKEDGSEDEGKTQIANVIEAILENNRINSLNIKRINQLFSFCEIATVWYAYECDTEYAGVKSKNKIKCRTYSPMLGHVLYPIFDDYDDMVGFGVEYKKKSGTKEIERLDFYAENSAIFYVKKDGEWEEDDTSRRNLDIEKIPVIYSWREYPVWEETSSITYEKEWILSRNGNYIRHNSVPNKVLTTDAETAGQIIADANKDNANQEYEIDNRQKKGGKKKPPKLSKDWILSEGSDLKVVEWQGSVEASRFAVETLKKEQHRVLQIPDLSFEAVSGVSTETMRIALQDAQMKVRFEAGNLEEFFDREISVIKEFVKAMFSNSKDVDALVVKSEIVPFDVSDMMRESQMLSQQTGGKAVTSQAEAVRQLHGTEKAKSILKELHQESHQDAIEPAF